MALLMRMGGVPSRVSTGFTSGSYDRKAREYVVRDVDAHSWVEVWYPGIGWVTFDPTPAASPARSQPDEDGAGAGASSLPGAPDLGGDIRSDPSRQVAVAEEGPPWTLIGFGAAAAVLLLGARGLARAPPPPPRWPPAGARWPSSSARWSAPAAGPARPPRSPSSSRAFARSPDAASYVRALRDQRYGGRGDRRRSARRAQRAGAARASSARGGRHCARCGALPRRGGALPPRRRVTAAYTRARDG